MKNKLIYSPESKLISDYINKNLKDYKKILVSEELELFEALQFVINKTSQNDLFNLNKTYVFYFNDSISKKIDKNSFELISKLQNKEKSIYICVVTNSLKSEKELSNYFEIINIPKLTYWSMSSLIEKKLKENSIEYDQNSFALIKSKLIPDPWIIDNELKKIILNTKKLSTKFVDENIIDYNNNSQYKLIENFFKKNYAKAISIFEEIYSEKKNIDEILAIFISYLLNLRIMSIYHNENKNKSLMEEFKIQKFQEEQYLSIIRNTTIDNLDNLLNNLVELDKGIKSGKKDPYSSFKLLISGGYHG